MPSGSVSGENAKARMRSHLEKEPFFANKVAIQKANSLQQADLRVTHAKKFGLPQPPRCGSSSGTHIRLGSSSKINPPPPTIILGGANSFTIPCKQVSKMTSNGSGIQPTACGAPGSKLPLKDITQMILMNQTKDASSKHQGQKGGVKYSKLLSH
jgi:hypothetical protein